MPGLRAAVTSNRLRLLFPVLSRLDATDANIARLEAQVTALTSTLEAMRADMERTAARVAGVAELAGAPSADHVRQRLQELDHLLGSAG